MTKRKGIIPPVNVAETVTHSTARDEFIRGGRGRVAPAVLDAAANPVTPTRGRPPLKRQVKPFPAKLWRDDALRVSKLQLAWQIDTRSSAQVSMTGILRSLLSASLPLLETMEAPASEEELMARLTELMRTR